MTKPLRPFPQLQRQGELIGQDNGVNFVISSSNTVSFLFSVSLGTNYKKQEKSDLQTTAFSKWFKYEGLNGQHNEAQDLEAQ